MMPERKPVSRKWVWVLLAIALIGLSVVLVWWFDLHELLPDQEQIRDWVESWGAWGPVAIILLEVFQVLVAFLPGQAIEAVSGYLYGPFWGTVIAMTGMITGSTILFILSRWFGRPLVIRLVGTQSMTRLDELVQRGGAPFFFLVWLFPFAPDDLACLAAGLTPMPTRQFLLLMATGRLLGVSIAVWVGANATRISPFIWAVFILAASLVALIVWRWGRQIQDSVLALIEKLTKGLSRP
jgi:uncharacterized membrane protein YdjX (TVP38/TMEM64 family)